MVEDPAGSSLGDRVVGYSSGPGPGVCHRGTRLRVECKTWS